MLNASGRELYGDAETVLAIFDLYVGIVWRRNLLDDRKAKSTAISLCASYAIETVKYTR